MQLNPAATKASSSANEVGWSAVHPNTLPPKTNGAISKPDAPSLRFSTSNLTAEDGTNSGGHIIVDTARYLASGLGRDTRHLIASMWLWMTLATQPRQPYGKHRFIFVRLVRN